MSLDFFDNILIPNLTLKGSPLPNEFLSQNQKGNKGPSADDLNNFAKMTQYKIQCFIEGIDAPRILKNENNIDWKIQIFSTDTIGFVKDTTKEDNERALINSWEIKETGRSLKAENARVKFVEDRKFLVDSYILENEKGKKVQKNINVFTYFFHFRKHSQNGKKKINVTRSFQNFFIFSKLIYGRYFNEFINFKKPSSTK